MHCAYWLLAGLAFWQQIRLKIDIRYQCRKQVFCQPLPVARFRSARQGLNVAPEWPLQPSCHAAKNEWLVAFGSSTCHGWFVSRHECNITRGRWFFAKEAARLVVTMNQKEIQCGLKWTIHVLRNTKPPDGYCQKQTGVDWPSHVCWEQETGISGGYFSKIQFGIRRPCC